MSDPFRPECPGMEQSKKMQELMNKKVELLTNSGIIFSPTTSTPKRTQPVAAANPAAVQNLDWTRPRLTKLLPADWPRWTFAPSDANVMIGMKLKVILKWPMLRQIIDAAGGAPEEVTNGPDEVWLSMRNVAGRMQPESVMLFIGSGLQTVGEDLRSKGVTACFLDEHSMLAGEWGAVNRALQNVSAQGTGGFAQRAKDLWSRNDLVLMANGKMISEMMPANSGNPMPKGITSVSVGMSMGEKLAVDLIFGAATPADATRIAGEVAAKPAELGLPGAKVQKTASGVTAHAEMTFDQLPDSMKKQMNEQFRPLIELAARRNQRTIQGKSTKGAVVIEGLDDGPRVIPAH